MNFRRFVMLALAASLVLVAFAGTASAHTSKPSVDGAIKFTWGWAKEPATTFLVNDLDLRIVDNATGAGIGGVNDSALKVEIRWGDEKLAVTGLKQPFGKTPGNYTGGSPITPTKAGIYSLSLKGTINGHVIDIEIPSTHEMTDIEATYWPAVEKLDTNSALEARLAALEAEVAALKAKATTQSTTPTRVTTQPVGASPVPALGLLALVGVLSIVAFRRRQ